MRLERLVSWRRSWLSVLLNRYGHGKEEWP
jgi:hypothetical protein